MTYSTWAVVLIRGLLGAGLAIVAMSMATPDHKFHETYTLKEVGSCTGKYTTCAVIVEDAQGKLWRMELSDTALVGDTLYRECWFGDKKEIRCRTSLTTHLQESYSNTRKETEALLYD